MVGHVFIDDKAAPYGKFVHEGTKQHALSPRKRKMLRWAVAGGDLRKYTVDMGTGSVMPGASEVNGTMTYEAEGSFTILREEFERLIEWAKGQGFSIHQIPPFEITVSYSDYGEDVRTDKLYKCLLQGEMGSDISQGTPVSRRTCRSTYRAAYRSTARWITTSRNRRHDR